LRIVTHCAQIRDDYQSLQVTKCPDYQSFDRTTTRIGELRGGWMLLRGIRRVVGESVITSRQRLRPKITLRFSAFRFANYGIQAARILPPSQQEAAANAFTVLEPSEFR
jgi:hypothetical protein